MGREAAKRCGKLFPVALRALFLACLSVGVALAGCGGSTPARSALSAPAEQAQLRGSPPALAALHLQADHLLSGGPAGFAARLRALRGHPVVVNKWASWCGPCQSEFPAFQRVSAGLGRQVAFLGLDGKDQPAAAAAFLARLPVSYPSYSDPDEAIARSIQAVTFYPQTIYFNAAGRQVYVHAGPYLTAAALMRDIRFYALR